MKTHLKRPQKQTATSRFLSKFKLSCKIITQEERKKLLELVHELIKDHNSEEFRNPVDVKGLGLVDYCTVIKRPMDLSTVTENIRKSTYKNVQEVLEDLQLIWTNCKVYNIENSQIVKSAIKLEKKMNFLFRKYYDEGQGGKQRVSKKRDTLSEEEVLSHSENDASITESKNEKEKEKENDERVNQHESPHWLEEKGKIISIMDKIRLKSKVDNLNKEGLAIVIKLVEKHCPNAISDSDGGEKCYIKTDMLDPLTFNYVSK